MFEEYGLAQTMGSPVYTIRNWLRSSECIVHQTERLISLHKFHLHLFSDISRPEKLRSEGDSEAGSPAHLGYSNPAFEKGEKDPENGGTGGKHDFITLFNTALRSMPVSLPKYGLGVS